METWIMAQKYPAFMDVAVPMASLPSEMAGRNWMTRRLIIDSIRNDVEWMNGNYTKQPRSAQFASVFYGIATLGGNQALHKAAPTRDKADQLLNQRLAAPFPADANDVLYQWDASRDYNPSAGLERIEAVLLAINSADDERNPPELGILDREIKRVIERCISNRISVRPVVQVVYETTGESGRVGATAAASGAVAGRWPNAVGGGADGGGGGERRVAVA
jgi:homoserine O-acetyltransferase/O-succinyltransferase